MQRGIDDAPAREAGRSNLVTARDLAVVCQAIATGAAASQTATDEMRGFLRAQQWNDGIPAGLPPGVRVGHKTGSVEGISHDAAIVEPADPASVRARGLHDDRAAGCGRLPADR